MAERETQEHTLEPVYDNDSRILILGSFPSVKSRELGFYYGHKSNRFWYIMEVLFATSFSTLAEKKEFLIKNHIALWDVISSCSIIGSSDAEIKNVRPNNLKPILEVSKINKIFTNGKKAYDLYNKYIYQETGIEALYLPSTSPANASWSLEKLIEAWAIIKNF